MFLNRAYELLIESDFELPELKAASAEEGVADVAITLAQDIPDLADAIVRQPMYQVSSTAFRLRIEGVAVYCVEAGRKIQVQPNPGADPAQVRLFLLGSAMGALLYQRGLFPLHGSAVETPWGAMVFVGLSGMGKSTLAAHFHQRGYRLLSDDVCAINRGGDGGFKVLPAFPKLRLHADAFGRLKKGAPPLPSAPVDVDKFILPLGEGYCPSSVSLGAVHVLMDQAGGPPELRPLRGFERIQQLAENLYRPTFLRALQSRGEVLRMAGEIAHSVGVFQLSRPRDAAQLDGLVSWLEDEWQQRSKAAQAKDS